jgi:hypothetical protein
VIGAIIMPGLRVTPRRGYNTPQGEEARPCRRVLSSRHQPVAGMAFGPMTCRRPLASRHSIESARPSKDQANELDDQIYKTPASSFDVLLIRASPVQVLPRSLPKG